ncbi:MAG: hypothetical protein AMJ81_02600, partial [Phycisphaerae bacterium SM23_33]
MPGREQLSRIMCFLAAGLCVVAAGALPASATDPSAAAPPGPPATASQPAGPLLLFGPTRPPTPQQTETVLAFTRQHLPEQYEQLRRLLSEDPDRAAPMVHRLYQLYVNVRRFPAEIREAAIGRYQANLAISWARRELRRSEDPAERKRLTERLAKLITQQFDHEQTVKEYEVKRYAQRVVELSAEVEQLRTNRSQVIAERMQRLLAPPPTTSSRPAAHPPSFAGRPLTPEQTAEVTAFTRQYMPELHRQLQKLQKDNPARATLLLRRVRPLVVRARRYPSEVREAAIDRHKMNISIFAAVGEIRRTEDPAKKEKLIRGLRELVAKQFDYDQPVKEFETKLLKQQLAETKAEVERRRRDRQQIIAERLARFSAPRPEAS